MAIGLVLEADEGTRTPDPLLTMEVPGLTPDAAQSRLASGIASISRAETSCARWRQILLDPGRFGPQKASWGQPASEAVLRRSLH